MHLSADRHGTKEVFKMKRISVLILCLVIVFSLNSCAVPDNIAAKTPFGADSAETTDTGTSFSPEGYKESGLYIFSNTLIYDWIDLAASAAPDNVSGEISDLKNSVTLNTSREFRDFSYTVGDTLLHLYISNADDDYGKIQAVEILTPDSPRGIPLIASLLSLHKGTPIEISLKDVSGMLNGDHTLKTDAYTSTARRTSGWLYMLAYYNAEYENDCFYSERVNTNKSEISNFKSGAYLSHPDGIPSEPLVFTGTGNSVVEVDTDIDEYVFHITGNEAEGSFTVKAYSADGKYKQLVNATGSYDGVTIDPDFITEKLEIEATGDWNVEILPLSSCPVIGVGGTLNMGSDAVILVEGDPSSAEIKGNNAKRYFSVKAYDMNGDSKLLVSETDNYDGTVKISTTPRYLVVTAVGKWRIKLNP